MKRRKLNLRKVFVTLLLSGLAIYSIVTIFTVQTVKSTPVGDYTCNGTIIKLCAGSDAVADYLGVE